MNKRLLIGLAVAGLVPLMSLAALPTDTLPPTPVGVCVSLQNGMGYQSTDSSTGGEVSKLQAYLGESGYLASEPTGYFGTMTLAAVKQFQSDNGISQTGFVGSQTRAKIQELSCGTGSTGGVGGTITTCPPGMILNASRVCVSTTGGTSTAEPTYVSLVQSILNIGAAGVTIPSALSPLPPGTGGGVVTPPPPPPSGGTTFGGSCPGFSKAMYKDLTTGNAYPCIDTVGSGHPSCGWAFPTGGQIGRDGMLILKFRTYTTALEGVAHSGIETVLYPADGKFPTTISITTDPCDWRGTKGFFRYQPWGSDVHLWGFTLKGAPNWMANTYPRLDPNTNYYAVFTHMEPVPGSVLPKDVNGTPIVLSSASGFTWTAPASCHPSNSGANPNACDFRASFPRAYLWAPAGSTPDPRDQQAMCQNSKNDGLPTLTWMPLRGESRPVNCSPQVCFEDRSQGIACPAGYYGANACSEVCPKDGPGGTSGITYPSTPIPTTGGYCSLPAVGASGPGCMDATNLFDIKQACCPSGMIGTCTLATDGRPGEFITGINCAP